MWMWRHCCVMWRVCCCYVIMKTLVLCEDTAVLCDAMLCEDIAVWCEDSVVVMWRRWCLQSQQALVVVVSRLLQLAQQPHSDAKSFSTAQVSVSYLFISNSLSLATCCSDVNHLLLFIWSWYDQLLAWYCHLSVCPSLCDAVHCG